MAEAEIGLEFNGPATAGGRMDVRWVGNTLLAMSDLVLQVKNADRYFERAFPPGIRVASFEEGSFDINLILEGLGDTYEALRDVAAGKTMTGIANVSALVLIVVGYLRLHGGQRVGSHTTSEDGERVEVDFENGEVKHASMPTEAFLAFMNPQVRRAARRVIEPIEREGVESVRLHAGDAGAPVVIQKSEARNFHFEDARPPEGSITRRTARVQPTSINFESEAWKVTEGAGKFTAKVEDEAFLRLIDAGAASIAKTDTFEVGLRTEQSVDANGKLKTTYAIERVIGQQRGAVQTNLVDDEPEAGSSAPA